MTDRQHRILASLVTEFIEQGEPVSSAWIASHSALGLSSATVRNILARLEEEGLVRQPHTSAGRVPTDSGYRRYVDQLLASRRRSRPSPEVEARLRRSGSRDDLLEHASQELSRAAHHLGFAVASGSPVLRLQHIDFIPLEGSRVLVIVVSAGGIVTHRVIQTEERCTASALSEAANYINAEFTGMTLEDVRLAIVERLREERALYDALMSRALTLAQSGLAEVSPEDTLHLQGTSFLVDELSAEQPDRQRTLETLRVLLQMIEEKDQLIELLSQSIDASGLTVVIGSEHGVAGLQPFSIVASTFQDGDRTGTVGVIGPTRMRYQRAISVVDGIGQTISRLLEGQ